MEKLKKEVIDIENDILSKLEEYKKIYSKNKLQDNFKTDISLTSTDINNSTDNQIDSYLLNILSPIEKRNILRLYSLRGAKYVTDIIDLKEYVCYIKSILDSYMANITTKVIEDDIWNVYYETNTHYKLKDNEAVLENTVSQAHMANHILHEFLRNIVGLFDCKYFKVKYKLIHSDTTGLAFIIIKCVKLVVDH